MKKQHIVTGVLLAGGLLMQTMTAHADLKYTKEMRMGEDTKAPPMQVISTYIRQNAKREETRQSMGPIQMNSVMLTLCDKKQTIKLDTKLKIYTVTPFGDDGPAPSAPATRVAPERDSGPAGTGKIVMTSSVKDLGEETVAGFKARHYMITNQMQSSGCAGDSNTAMKMEVWVTDIREPLACQTAGDGDPARAYAGGKSNCKITFEYKGDKDAYTKVYSGMILRMKMYQGNTDKVMMIQDTTMLSQAKLEDDSLFAVPADYKQVTAEQFQQAQSKAMMDAMMSGAMQNNRGGGNGNGDDGDAADNNADNGAGQDANDQEEQPQEEPKEQPKKEEKKKKPRIKIPGLPF